MSKSYSLDARNATSLSGVSCVPARHIAEIISLLGSSTLLLGWPKGSKGTKKRWGHLNQSAMQDGSHLESLAHGNVGVALGPVSGNLVSIDVDCDDGFSEFLQLNPAFANTLQSRGKRGGNVWFRVSGFYPPLTKLKRHGKAWGEFRAKGGQTIIYGTHPSGGDYTITNRVPPIEVEYQTIRWPEGVDVPVVRALQKSS